MDRGSFPDGFHRASKERHRIGRLPEQAARLDRKPAATASVALRSSAERPGCPQASCMVICAAVSSKRRVRDASTHRSPSSDTPPDPDPLGITEAAASYDVAETAVRRALDFEHVLEPSLAA